VTAEDGGRTDCREVQMLLGVYVLGAIDRTERPLVDEHLRDCVRCRDELAGLAPLPAMLGRVSLEEAERIAEGGHDEPAELSPDVLNSLLRQVSKRRGRLWRGAVAVAAAAIIAAGTGTAIVVATNHPGQAAAHQVAATNPVTHVTAVVDYGPTNSGSWAGVRVSGIKQGTACNFYVIGSGGAVLAGYWTVTNAHGMSAPYSTMSSVSATSIRDFQITAAGKVLVNIPVH
jgi:anti-sigma factor RsiW